VVVPNTAILGIDIDLRDIVIRERGHDGVAEKPRHHFGVGALRQPRCCGLIRELARGRVATAFPLPIAAAGKEPLVPLRSVRARRNGRIEFGATRTEVTPRGGDTQYAGIAQTITNVRFL